MKDKKIYKFSLCFLVFLFCILSFFSMRISYSSEVLSLEPKENSTLDDQEIWSFLEGIEEKNTDIVESVDANVDFHKVIVADKDDAEDPNKIVKKNESNKGRAKATTASKDVKKYETNETSLGIDVSTWQGDIDWKKVKQSGISFAMIRVGFRRMDSGTIVMDNQFLNNIKGAISNQINVGVYFFSMAKNSQEALEEAQWVSQVIKNYDITYPVAIDIEIFNQNRLKGVSYSTLTNNALVFCDYIKKQGYTPMIYSYANAFTKYFETAKFSGQRIWLAQFNDTVTYKGNYHMWQYTSSGSVPGIQGRVDMNVAYFSVTNDVTKASTVNGITNTGNLEPVAFKEMSMETKTNKAITLRSSPYTTLPNKAGTLDSGTSITVTGMGTSFIRILYNGNTFYVNDTDCFEMRLEPISFTSVDLRVLTEKEVTLLYQPYSFLNQNTYQILSKGETLHIVGLHSAFVEILYNEKTYYINDVDFYTILSDDLYSRSS